MKTRRKTITSTDGAALRAISRKVLAWYDTNARALPWRVGPHERRGGVRPDPYRVWMSEIMLQQTTVPTVTARFGEFVERWPTVFDLAKAPRDAVLGAWAGLGYYARARNLHACAQYVVEHHDGIFPQDVEALRALPGVGEYTAAAIAAIAFDVPVVVMDANIERVMARLHAVETPLPAAKPQLRKCATPIWPRRRSGDFAQALMDLGASLCTAKKALCTECPLKTACTAHERGNALSLPRKQPKQQKPTRYGAVYLLENRDGALLLERRPDKGLLGGMLGFPGSAWDEAMPKEQEGAPVNRSRWQEVGVARHSFTHFHLELTVFHARTKRAAKSDEIWQPPDQMQLPTVMKKALKLLTSGT